MKIRKMDLRNKYIFYKKKRERERGGQLEGDKNPSSKILFKERRRLPQNKNSMRSWAYVYMTIWRQNLRNVK